MTNINRHGANLLLTAAVALVAIPATADQTASPQTDTAALEPTLKLPGRQWQVDRDGLQLKLTQFPLDVVRAFYQGRGFSPEHSSWIANSCVFQAIARNTLPTTDKTPVEVDTRRWRMVMADDNDAGERVLKLKAVWRPIWQQSDASRAAQIAFQWALFPTNQTFYPGDYNWGMITFGPKPGSHFGLKLEWTVGGKQFTHTIKKIECPTQ